MMLYITGVPARSMPVAGSGAALEQPQAFSLMESGQMVVDKARHWRALELAVHFNVHAELYFRLLHGDKDTFLFAWLALGNSFHFVRHSPAVVGTRSSDGRVCGHTMGQFHPSQPSAASAALLFLHRNYHSKWHVGRAATMAWESAVRFEPHSPLQQRRVEFVGPPLCRPSAVVAERSSAAIPLDGTTLDAMARLEARCLQFFATFPG